MRYWVIKADPKNLDPDSSIHKEQSADWWGGKPRNLQTGDRLFFWKSSPDMKLYALGELTRFLKPEKNNGYSFRVVFRTEAFLHQPTLASLKSLFGENVPSFLRRGPSGTFFPLTGDEAQKLYAYVAKINPKDSGTWDDLKAWNIRDKEMPDLDISVEEGTQRLVTHLLRERNASIVAAKKEQVLKKDGKLECEVCSFNFATAYGNTLGYNFCEVHHRLPLAKGAAKRRTNLSDLAIICSNCHRMIHRTNPMKSIENFKRVLKNR